MSTYQPTYTTPDSREAAFTQALTRPRALNWEVAAYAVILVLALVTRFADLGARVMSHDESLHTYYSWRLYEFGEFNHTPLMHGPLLFHMTALFYMLFGDNDFTARIYPAALGVLIVVLIPYLYRRWLGRVGAVITAVLLLISPQLMYYSRYIRHDIPTMFYALLVLYAILQYIDGLPPRRAIWLWFMAGAMLGMMAEMEISFIYVALFGSFLTLYWLMRMMQDIGVQRRPASAANWQAPPIQAALGHLLLLALVAIIAFTLGELLRYVLKPAIWIPSRWWLDLPIFAILYVPLAGLGLLRSQLGGGQREGTASALVRSLANGRSALGLILAGVVIGAVIALWIACVIDVIKLEQVWTSSTVMSANDQTFGPNMSKEFASAAHFSDTMFVRLLTWVGVPVLVLLLLVFLSAVLVFPGHLPLPWREILLLILVIFLATSVLVAFERRSFVKETEEQPFAVDPNAVSAQIEDGYDRTPIVVSWVLATVIVLGVLATRLLTDWWSFLNRQPVFDVLIIVGTLVLPRLAAFPMYWAGYNLENYDPNSDTVEAALGAFIPFALVALTVGLAWNWKVWLPAAAIFTGLFVFFFTTVFSNENGLATGTIGSLGYWLEQQGVRRGSQPQYYYVLTQLPVYEFLPLIGAMLAGVYGLGLMWRQRRARVEDAWRARYGGAPVADTPPPDEHTVARPADETMISAAQRTQPLARADLEAEASMAHDDRVLPRLLRPYDWDEEQAARRERPEWIGELPFLGLVAYWGIMILLGLTIAGEKMPWLTTHLTLPLILVTGWWLGRVAEGLRPDTLRDTHALTLGLALPVALIALAHVLESLWGTNSPFQGRASQELMTTGTWLGALLILLGALYLIGRSARQVGLGQAGRLAIVTGALILGMVTARAAFKASFVYYDYPTEFLVYAHSGPAVKTVMREVDRIAEITNEGSQMRVVYDDDSSWPFTWYLRDYPNYTLLRGEAGSVDPGQLDGAKVVIVGSKKINDVRTILGDRYYEYGYIRLWWPMQEYFYLTYERIANLFSASETNFAAGYYRQALFDIWWERNYHTYAQAKCIEEKQARCVTEATWGNTPEERARSREACQRAVANECRADDRYEVKKWPVSDRLYFFVDKQVAAQVWDAGIGGSTVNIREPEYPEDHVYQEIAPELVWGTTAGLLSPRGVAIGPDNLIYVADTDHNRIAVLNASGALVRVIGAAPGDTENPARLTQPWGLDIGPDGYLYVADTWNHQVKVFTLTGELVRSWGHEGVVPQDVTDDAFWGPRDIKIGPDGNVYVADTGNKRVRVYTPQGLHLRDLGGAGAALGQMDEPVGLAFNPVSGDLYVAEAWNKRIQVFDRTGFPLRVWNVNMWFRNRQSYNRPYLAVSPDGTLVFVTDMDDRRRIVAYNLEGMPVYSFSPPAQSDPAQAGLRSPAGLAFDSLGRLIVVDAEQARLLVFPSSQISGSILPQPPQELPAPAGDQPEVMEEPTEVVTEEAAEAATADVTEETAETVTEEATAQVTE